jgi:hypothetical protein
MNSLDQSDDLEMRKELAGFLGWYRIKENSQGILTGKLPGVRSLVPLVVPDWSGDRKQIKGVEDALDKRGMKSRYVQNLLALGQIDPNDDRKKNDFLVEASPRQRCLAALVTLRAGNDQV